MVASSEGIDYAPIRSVNVIFCCYVKISLSLAIVSKVNRNGKI